MLFYFLRLVVFQLLIAVVAMIESTFAVPFVTLILFLLMIKNLSTIWFFVSTAITSLILAAIFMQSWLFFLVVFAVAGILMRANSMQLQTRMFKTMALVAVSALLVSFFAKPEVSSVFVLHSLVSFGIATIGAHKWFSVKGSKLQWDDLRFKGN